MVSACSILNLMSPMTTESMRFDRPPVRFLMFGVETPYPPQATPYAVLQKRCTPALIVSLSKSPRRGLLTSAGRKQAMQVSPPPRTLG
jgi:hypothetical protein